MLDTDADPFETPGRVELATLDAEDRAAPLAMEDQLLRRDLKAKLFGDDESVQIGRYEILRRVGRGGMGTVYLARDHELDRNVAVKLLRPDRAAGGERMLLEARALARLAHPNVVTVHEVGRHGDRVFIAMEWIEGRTLRAWSSDGTRAPAEIGRVLAQVARGLGAAHRAGLVHRDVKPDNVILGDDGRVRVVDFGVAKANDADDARRTPSTSVRDGGASVRDGGALTQTGALLGTPGYMAAEQFLGEPTDARTDVFALCVVIYEAFTGQRPFDGDDAVSVAYAVMQGEPKPLSTTAMPTPLAALVMRGLQRHAADRPALDSLAEALEQVGAPTMARTRPRGARLVMAISAVGLGLGIAIPRVMDLSGARAAAESTASRTAIAAVIAAPDDGARLALAEAFASDFPDAPAAERAIALATAGDIRWRSACPVGREGLCIDVAALARTPAIATCMAPSRGVITARARDAATANAAREQLRAAVALAGATTGDDAVLGEAFGESIARARTQLADGELESYLTIVPPPDLDFVGAKALSEAAARSFLLRLLRDGERLVEDYAAVKAAGNPRWTLVAILRTGMVLETPQVALAMLPATDAATCTFLAQETIPPVVDNARHVYDYCLGYAAEHGLEAEPAAATCRERRDALGGA